MRTHIHVPSGIGTHDPSVRVVESSMCLRPCGHWDRPVSLPNFCLEIIPPVSYELIASLSNNAKLSQEFLFSQCYVFHEQADSITLLQMK